MPNYKLTIQYDGTNYHGWQIQPNLRTVQGELTRALSLLDHQPATVHGAGRTDAGVHAEGQVATVLLNREFPTDELRDAINGNLDRDIRVIECLTVDPSFHARFSARSKTYRYRIWTDPVVSAFDYLYVYHQRGVLDIEAMNEAAFLLLGKQDFSAFTVIDNDSEDRVRTLMRLELQEMDHELHVVARADGFLRFMVRTIVGTLLEVGRGRIAASEMSEILSSQDRAKAGATAPAHGLTLLRVDY